MVRAPLRVDAHVTGLIEEARSAERGSRYGVARQRYEAALARLRAPGDAPLASALLRWIGGTHKATGDLEAAMDCYDAALSVARATESTADVAHALNCIAILCFERGRLDEASNLYREARSLAEQAGEWKLVAMVDQNLGNVANVRGHHDVARAGYGRALERYRALGLEEYVGPLLNNLGRLHTDLGDFDEAEAALAGALESCARTGNRSYRVLIQVNRARLFLAREAVEAARDACEEALELSLALDEDRWLGEIHKHRGVILRRTARPRLAEESLQRALTEAGRRQELLLQAEISKEMALLYRSQERNREMLECLNRAHDAFAELRVRDDLADVDREIARLEESFLRIVSEWGDSIESKDLYTRGHCDRVADMACALARDAGLERASLTWFRMGALLHDVGKVAVPSGILNKPGGLTDDEWAVMRRHPETGVELVANVEFPWDIRPMILHHHERWDGGGYPHGLAGSEIPLAARILCVADVFDALTTTRSYRHAFSADVALEIMAGDAGHVFDPELFELFRAGLRIPERGRGRWSSGGTVVVQPVPWASRLLDAFERRPPVPAIA